GRGGARGVSRSKPVEPIGSKRDGPRFLVGGPGQALRATLCAPRITRAALIMMHIVFIEPRFPANQKQFIKGLAQIGATISAIGEGSKDSLDAELRSWLTHYEEVKNVCDPQAVLAAVRFI